jgi:hypothetical protein
LRVSTAISPPCISILPIRPALRARWLNYINFVKAKTGAAEPTLLPTRSGPAARKIFIVHGHDEGARESLARYVERLGFEPIILHEQASQGKRSSKKSRRAPTSGSQSCC